MALLGDKYQVLVAHQLGHRRYHLRRKPWTKGGERGGIGLIEQEPVPEFAYVYPGNGPECHGIVRVQNEPGDLVRLIRREAPAGSVSTGPPRGSIAPRHAPRRNPQPVPPTGRPSGGGGFRHELAERAEGVVAATHVARQRSHRWTSERANASTRQIPSPHLREIQATNRRFGPGPLGLFWSRCPEISGVARFGDARAHAHPKGKMEIRYFLFPQPSAEYSSTNFVEGASG